MQVVEPEGGFYLFPDFSSFAGPLAEQGITGSRTFCEALLEETGVAILPGVDFGRPADELTARLAYVDFDGHKALRAVAEIPAHQTPDEQFLRHSCGRTVKAVELIVQWLLDKTRV